MAQGCHLIYSQADREHFPIEADHPTAEEISRQFTAAFNLPWGRAPSQGIVQEDGVGIRIDRGQAMCHGVGEAAIHTFEDRYGRLTPQDQAFLTGLLCARGDRQADILRGLGNPSLGEEMAGALPSALREILEHDPRTVGLFQPARFGASSWISTLKNSNENAARGLAYEVLATASLFHKAAGDLKIGAGDQVDFGLKQQASYGGQGNLIVTDGREAGFFFQPYRGTVEADLLITRHGGLESIAIDFKHSIGHAAIDRKELEGVKVALLTGEIQEWHFISNVSFSSSVIIQVNEINQELQKAGCPPIQLHGNYDWR